MQSRRCGFVAALAGASYSGCRDHLRGGLTGRLGVINEELEHLTRVVLKQLLRSADEILFLVRGTID